MKIKIKEFHQKHPIFSTVINLLAGAFISWAVCWVLPSQNVTANNIPQKELTCILDYSYPMIARKSSDNRLQLLYDGNTVSMPYVYGITVTNTGAYAVTNEDFKESFSIDFSGSKQLVYAQVVKSSNGAIAEEVLSNAKIDETVLTITDFYLNTEESFGIYLIVDGKPDTISYHSRISGISKLILRNTPKEKLNNRAKIGIFALVTIAIIFVIFIVWVIIWSIKWKKQEKDFIQKYIEARQDNK